MCLRCLLQSLDTDDNCPVCRTALIDEDMRKSRVRTSQIDKLRVACPNKAAGFDCTFSTVLKRRHADMEGHIYECSASQHESQKRMKLSYEKHLVDLKCAENLQHSFQISKLEKEKSILEAAVAEYERILQG
jgi:hypothetical protein